MKKFLIVLTVLLLSIKAVSAQNEGKPVLYNQFRDYVEWLQAHEDTSALNKSVNEWLGTPYKYAGKTKSGVDCSGLVYNIYKEVYNKIIPPISKLQWKFSKRIFKNALLPGDLVFFRSKRSPSGWHVGIYLGNGDFVHSPRRGDVVKISNLNNKYYLNNYKGAGRVI